MEFSSVKMGRAAGSRVVILDVLNLKPQLEVHVELNRQLDTRD